MRTTRQKRKKKEHFRVNPSQNAQTFQKYAKSVRDTKKQTATAATAFSSIEL
jgi:hypothetical protein